MKFLVEMMETKYIHNALSARLEIALKELPDNETVDLNRAKLSPSAYRTIKSHMGRLNFVNSGDAKLNDILSKQQNFERHSTDVTCELPAINSYEDIVSFVKNIPTNLPYYKFNVTIDRNQQYALICLILARPDLKIDISNMYVEVFTHLNALDCPIGKSVYYVSVSDNRCVRTDMPVGDVLTIPCQFGLTKPIDLENPDKHHMFYKVVENIRKSFKVVEYCSFIEAAKKLL